MDIKFLTYLVYLLVTALLTVWVGRTLARNGQIFLRDALGDERLATSVNHLLAVGFYLLNFGYVALQLRIGHAVTTPTDAVEALSIKVGLVLLVVGAVHLTNVFVLSRFRHRRRAVNRAVPTAVPAPPPAASAPPPAGIPAAPPAEPVGHVPPGLRDATPPAEA